MERGMNLDAELFECVAQPCGLQTAHETNRDEFGFQKPQTADEVIFYCKYVRFNRCIRSSASCRSGARAGRAAAYFAQRGYTNLKTYPGSMMDWLSP